MNQPGPKPQQRGTTEQPKNRFKELHYEPIAVEPDPDWPLDEQPSPKTMFFRENTRSALSWNDSPDIPFDASLNPYRGCEHGCAYCYARPSHEYLGFSIGLDFESRILVKEDAPELLRRELASKKWKPRVIAISGVTDAYQPAEARFQITRRCLEVLEEFGNPAVIITKNALILRDLDILTRMAKKNCVAVFLSVTSLDVSLWKELEPRTSRPERRLDAIRTLSEAGVPTGCMIAPVIPGLTDQELPAILNAVAEAGASRVNYVMLRLPNGLDDLFETWLEDHAPLRKDKVLSRIRSMRGGKMNDTKFGRRMRGQDVFAKQIHQLFENGIRRSGIDRGDFELSTQSFRRPGPEQLDFFTS